MIISIRFQEGLQIYIQRWTKKKPKLPMSAGMADNPYLATDGGQRPYKVRQKLKGQFFPINTPKPFIYKSKRRFWAVSQANSLSPLLNFAPKHIQTPLNTFDSSLFSIITRQFSYTRSFSPWFHTMDLRFRGVDEAFQLQSTLFSFYSLFQLFLVQ